MLNLLYIFDVFLCVFVVVLLTFINISGTLYTLLVLSTAAVMCPVDGHQHHLNFLTSSLTCNQQSEGMSVGYISISDCHFRTNHVSMLSTRVAISEQLVSLDTQFQDFHNRSGLCLRYSRIGARTVLRVCGNGEAGANACDLRPL